MTTLTDRYVWAATRSVSENQRSDLERELRERIGDEIDALVEAGRLPDAAERAALTDLGDPVALAASYVDRPLQLIGPRYYLIWLRTLKVVAWVSLPFAALGIAIAQTVTGTTVGGIIGAVVSGLITVAVHIGFWTTLVFAILERVPASAGQRGIDLPWSLDQLPAVPHPTRAARLSELIGSLVFLTLFATVIVGQQFGMLLWIDGMPSAPLLSPELWSFWLPYFLGLIVLEMLFAVALYLRGWSWWFAGANLLLNIAFTVPALWLFLTGRLVNPAVLDAIGWPWGDAGPIFVAIIVVIVIAGSAWDVIDGVLKTRRAERLARPRAAQPVG